MDISIKFLSIEMKISIKQLIKKLSKIGIFKDELSFLNQKEYDTFKKYIDNEKKESYQTLVLKRKIRTTLNVSTLSGKNKSVQVEVRKQKTYIKNNKINKEIVPNENISIKSQIIENKKDKLKKDHKKNVFTTEKRNIQITSRERNHINKSKKNIVNKNKNISAFYSEVINTKKNVQLNKENWKLNTEEKKDYHVTTFLHARQAEDDSDHAVEIEKKNRSRNIKNYRSKKTINKYYDGKNNKDDIRFNSRYKKNYKNKNKSILLQQAFQKPKTIVNRDIIINETITVSELANKMSTKSTEVIKIMMNMGIIGNINQTINQDTAQLIAEDRGHKVILQRENALEEKIMKDRDIGDNIFLTRAPVVTIMGHVDHGKTSLLDYICSTQITTGEAGGITQHIGAYNVKTDLGTITFLDTPGHSAFTAMRSRGVKITDIVILVVAADDGVMPQTIEAIQHAQEANVPIIVAINKIDKIESDIDKVKNDLMKYEIISEEWGGQNIFVSISAKTGQGIHQLLNAILLQAEMLELKAIFTGMAEGIVIESSLDKGRGPIATILVTKGCLKKGDVILCGCEYGRVKTLRNDAGFTINSAGPSVPVEILGLSKVPYTGDIITVVRNEKQAKEVAFYRKNKSREIKLATQTRSNLENMFDNIKKYNHSELKIILKSDVQGSLEAISSALLKLSTDVVKINIISTGIGSITETDASLALASNAIILGFNVRADSSAKKIVISENLDLRYYSVIYNLIDEVKLAITGLLSPEYKQNITGLAQVRNIFKTPKFGSVAGCMVIEGIMKRNSPIHILRDNVVIYEGELESLRRFKEDVNEVHNGMECGIAIKNYNDIRVNDHIESFEMKEIKRII